jgi:hypothetical protein
MRLLPPADITCQKVSSTWDQTFLKDSPEVKNRRSTRNIVHWFSEYQEMHSVQERGRH